MGKHNASLIFLKLLVYHFGYIADIYAVPLTEWTECFIDERDFDRFSSKSLALLLDSARGCGLTRIAPQHFIF